MEVKDFEILLIDIIDWLSELGIQKLSGDVQRS